MKSLALCLVLLSGCATVDFTAARSDDVHCNKGEAVSVVVHRAAWVGCAEEIAKVDAGIQGTHLKPGWVVIFTDGFAGFELNHEMKAYNPKGVTYVNERVIVVEAMAPAWVVAHELGHADDVDNGRPNTRDGAR